MLPVTQVKSRRIHLPGHLDAASEAVCRGIVGDVVLLGLHGFSLFPSYLY